MTDKHQCCEDECDCGAEVVEAKARTRTFSKRKLTRVGLGWKTQYGKYYICFLPDLSDTPSSKVISWIGYAMRGDKPVPIVFSRYLKDAVKDSLKWCKSNPWLR